jgi:hypothetical protein
MRRKQMCEQNTKDSSSLFQKKALGVARSILRALQLMDYQVRQLRRKLWPRKKRVS